MASTSTSISTSINTPPAATAAATFFFFVFLFLFMFCHSLSGRKSNDRLVLDMCITTVLKLPPTVAMHLTPPPRRKVQLTPLP